MGMYQRLLTTMARSTHTHEVDESTLVQNNPEIAREIHIVKRSLARNDPEHDRYVEFLRKQIEDGTYERDTMDIAEALIADRRSERSTRRKG